jgi:hypothetical protein
MSDFHYHINSLALDFLVEIAKFVDKEGNRRLDHTSHLPAADALLGNVTSQSFVVVKVIFAEH